MKLENLQVITNKKDLNEVEGGTLRGYYSSRHYPSRRVKTADIQETEVELENC